MNRAELEKTAYELAEELKIPADKLIDITVTANLRKSNRLGKLKDVREFSVEEIKRTFDPKSFLAKGYQTRFTKWRNKVAFRTDELSLWTGISGHGKSQFLGQLALDLIEDGAKVCLASLEMRVDRIMHRLIRQAAGLRKPSDEYIDTILKYYEGKIKLIDHRGSLGQTELLSNFKTAKEYYGIDVFIIDSLMMCGMAEDDYNAQKKFVDQLCNFKFKFNCHIHLVTHPRKALNESISPGKLDIKGTGTISDLADNCFSVWRNKRKQELAEQNQLTEADKHKCDAFIKCVKQRNGEWEGSLGLWYHNDSFQFLEFESLRPYQYVKYSRL